MLPPINIFEIYEKRIKIDTKHNLITLKIKCVDWNEKLSILVGVFLFLNIYYSIMFKINIFTFPNTIIFLSLGLIMHFIKYDYDHDYRL